MFLAGADGQTAELRPPSIKGMLRFWWRAAQAGATDFKQREAAIFGSGGENGGRSSFSLQVMADNLDGFRSRDPLPNHPYRVKGYDLNILEYLAYGTYTRHNGANVFYREYIKPDFEFELKFRLQNSVGRDGLIKALRAFCLFGALGAKSRNGFGSFKVLDVAGVLATPVLKAELSLSPSKEIMDTFCPPEDIPGDIPEFSGFSRKAKLYKTTSYLTWDDCLKWDDCLAELAHAYRDNRLALEPRHEFKRRQYIGSPIVVKKNQESVLDRRAKPYFLRVHEHNGKYDGYVLYLPSQYLPLRYCSGLAIDEKKYNTLSLPVEELAFEKTCSKFNTSLAGDLEVVC